MHILRCIGSTVPYGISHKILNLYTICILQSIKMWRMLLRIKPSCLIETRHCRPASSKVKHLYVLLLERSVHLRKWRSMAINNITIETNHISNVIRIQILHSNCRYILGSRYYALRKCICQNNYHDMACYRTFEGSKHDTQSNLRCTICIIENVHIDTANFTSAADRLR